ncbi:hypothetical protein BDC45DRAFT_520926 [Circinella umbellata]|nr:hypothetical protein BDC45DRAFT_520926 [Circinella umbellata]
MSPDYFMTTKMERWRLVNALVAYDEFYENKTFLELCTQMIADVKNYSEKRNNMGKTIETITKQIETLKKLKCLNNKSQQETTEPLSKPFNSFSSNGSIRIGRQQQFNTNYESIKIGRQQINIKTNHGAASYFIIIFNLAFRQYDNISCNSNFRVTNENRKNWLVHLKKGRILKKVIIMAVCQTNQLKIEIITIQ